MPLSPSRRSGTKAVLSDDRSRSPVKYCRFILKSLWVGFLDSNLHSPQRRLIELRIEHADLDVLIDRASHGPELDELLLRRLKKRRLILRDEIARLERELSPDEPA